MKKGTLLFLLPILFGAINASLGKRVVQKPLEHRAVEATKTDFDDVIVEFSNAVSSPGGEAFFLGAAQTEQGDSAFVKAMRVRNSDGTYHVVIEPTPTTIDVIQSSGEILEEQNNPILSKKNLYMAQVGENIALIAQADAFRTDPINAEETVNLENRGFSFVIPKPPPPGKKPKIQPFTDPFIAMVSADGSRLAGNDNIVDAGGSSGAKPLCIATDTRENTDNVFVLVEPKDGAAGIVTGETTRAFSRGGNVSNELGLAILASLEDGMAQPDQISFAANGQAFPARSADIHFAFHRQNATNPIERAEMPPIFDMWVNPKNGDIYLAVCGIRRNDNSKDGGIISILRARTTQNDDGTYEAQINSVMNRPQPAFFNATKKDQYTIGFYLPDTDNTALTACAHKVRTLHIGEKDYLIVVGAVGTDADEARKHVRALPLDRTTGLLGKSDFSGVANRTQDFIAIDSTHADKTLTDVERPVVIGANRLAKPVEDITIVGETVYVSNTDGIHCSSAVVNPDNGCIDCWTSWVQVLPARSETTGAQFPSVKAFGVNKKDATFHWLAGDNKTVRFQAWGDTGSIVTDAGENSNLSEVIDTIFPGGTSGMVHFDVGTPGLGNIAMLVVLGTDANNNNVVAVMQTGRRGMGGIFEPTVTFETSGTNQNVFTFQNQVLNNLGELISATLLKRDDSASMNDVFCGHLYIAGAHGMVRLQDNNGNGWNSKTGLNDLMLLQNFSFVSIGDFESLSVIKDIDSDGENIYCALFNTFRQIDKDGNTLNELENVYADDIFVFGNIGMINTFDGLFTFNVGDLSTLQGPLSGVFSADPSKFKFIPIAKTGNTQGIMYILELDTDNNASTLHKFLVDSTQTEIQNQFKRLDSFSLGADIQCFDVDGPFVYLVNQNKDFDDFVRVGVMEDGTLTQNSLVNQLSDVGNFVGCPVNAAGRLVVPNAKGAQIKG